jgi:hypothetical protein
VQDQSRRQPTQGGNQDAFPRTHHFRDFNGITRTTQKKKPDRFDGVKENKVHQSAEHADNSGEHQMQRLLAQDKLFAKLDGSTPMAAEELVRSGDQPVDPG